MNEDFAAAGNFGGIARLFPLPNLVLYPHATQPLHIFEPRYRQMTADALADDRLIAVVLLRPGWEGDYEGRPALYPIACLGRIVAEQQLKDGRYNILLTGLSRLRIDEEIEPGKLYRSARATLLQSTPAPATSAVRKLRQSIVEAAPHWFPADAAAVKPLHQLLKIKVPLGILCDMLSFGLPFPAEAKQFLLAELDAERRARALLAVLQTKKPSQLQGGDDHQFPPEFSPN